jgi:NAD(P)-dependent dehydrogenase (short-subunit alcohol dehydrogenase family)/carbon monoxide dehydrogenase subunit G
MVRLNRSIWLSERPEAAFRFLSDMSNLAEWDPSVAEASRLSHGPIREGSRFRLVLTVGPLSLPMTYQITRLVPPALIAFTGRGETFEAVDQISLAPVDGGTHVRYRVQVSTGSPPAAFAAFLIRAWFKRNARIALKRLCMAFTPPVARRRITPGTRLADATILPGLMGFSRLGYHWSRRRWRPLAKDLSGRCLVVTGATSGIGKAAANRLAAMGATVIVVARNSASATAVVGEVRRHTGNPQVFFELADLSRMDQVRQLADRLARRPGGIHGLINNAGALFRRQQQSPEGRDMSLAVNLMGPFLLTNLLIPSLAACSPSRIIMVSSGGMYLQPMALNLLEQPASRYNGVQAYAVAKRAQVILTTIWNDALAKRGVTAHAMHPGWVDTPGISKSLPGFHRITRRILRSPHQGADTVVWLAAADEPLLSSGGFWLDRRLHPVHVRKDTRESEADRQALWAFLCRKVGWDSPEGLLANPLTSIEERTLDHETLFDP